MERSRDWHKKVSELVRAGLSIEEIADRLQNATAKEVTESIVKHKQLTTWYDIDLYPAAEIGSKDDSTFNEDIALNGYPKYTYNELSYEEKCMYNNFSFQKILNKVDNREVEEYILKLKNYFKRYKGKDLYYVAMKYHALTTMEEYNLTVMELARILNYTNHTTITKLRKNYVKLKDHEEFIETHFELFVNNFIYPIASYAGTMRDNYIYKYKLTILDEYGKEQQIPQ